MSYLDNGISRISLNSNGNHFFHLYKNENKVNDFKEKMKEHINKIRLKERQNTFDINRALLNSDDEDKSQNNCFYRNTRKSKNRWANLMMLAEWFMLTPETFYDDYVMKFCPYGKHVLLVSEKKKTMIFNKNGIMLASFKSSLPGGGINEQGNTSHKCAIFDCIYNKEHNKLYFLDIIYYMKQDFREMPAENRFNWLENFIKLELTSGIDSSCNLSVEVLPIINCNKDNLKEIFKNEAPYEIDGLLFYNKNDAYVSGSTYSSMWLKPYMVPELFDINVHDDYTANMPMDYASYREDIILYNEKFGWKDVKTDNIDDQSKHMDLC